MKFPVKKWRLDGISLRKLRRIERAVAEYFAQKAQARADRKAD